MQQVDLIDGESLILDITDHPTLDLESRNRLKVILNLSRGVETLSQIEFNALSWLEVMAIPDPLEVVKRIEGIMGLMPGPIAPNPKSARALVFTVLALFLAARINDAKPWHVRSLSALNLGVDDWVPTDISMFPVLERRLVDDFESAAVNSRSAVLTPAWILYRGFDPVAALDERGGIHVHGVRFDLHEIYVNTGCDVYATTNTASANLGA